MIYLLSQMILALAVAIVLGIALGWIIHRHTHTKVVQKLKKRIRVKDTHLAQAESDVAMLSDEYDELRRNSQDEIAALRAENQQIPSLSSNLEKSQLLVQQLMGRHEARVKELNIENQRLADKLAQSSSITKPAATSDAAPEPDNDPFDDVIEVADEWQRELEDIAELPIADLPIAESPIAELPIAELPTTDDSTFTLDDEPTTPFDPVNQQDDLQQIFGIGPLTEKALNDLGITSYSQLAELKQHDIQRIADALDIGTSRIERDNWVGNARRQLEEVLEQL